MKKNLFYLFALICSMSLFTACSDDDAPDYSKTIEEEMAGDYKGTLDIELEGTTIASNMPKNIAISKAGTSAINLLLADFNLMSMELGDIELKNCQLSQKDNSYSFTGTQSLNIEKYQLTADVVATGTIAEGKITVLLDIAAKLNGMAQKVKVTYNGTRLTGTESSEAKITAFFFDMSNAANAVVIEQPVINADNTIAFRVDEAAVEADASVLKALVPTFTISDKATASVESGKAMDFSKDVAITLVAEDGTVAEYVVKTPVKNAVMKFSFETWYVTNEGQETEYWNPEPKEQLSTSNEGASLMNNSLLGTPIGFPVMPEDNGFEGKAAKLVTLYSKSHPFGGIAPITSGSLFTGQFKTTFPALKSTKFGISYSKNPILFRGVYKYKSGDNYVDGTKQPVEENLGIKDECAIQAVLYEAVDENGEEVVLTGEDINTSQYRVALAQLEDGSEKAEWTKFNIPFKYLEGKSYEKGKEYKLAIVCSSSKDGDKFKGAVNSTLIVDELEVIGE